MKTHLPSSTFGTFSPRWRSGDGLGITLAASEALNCCRAAGRSRSPSATCLPFERMNYLALLMGWGWRKARRGDMSAPEFSP